MGQGRTARTAHRASSQGVSCRRAQCRRCSRPQGWWARSCLKAASSSPITAVRRPGRARLSAPPRPSSGSRITTSSTAPPTLARRRAGRHMPEVRRQMHHHAQFAPWPHGQPSIWMLGQRHPVLEVRVGLEAVGPVVGEGELLNAAAMTSASCPVAASAASAPCCSRARCSQYRLDSRLGGRLMRTFCAGLRRFLLNLFRGPPLCTRMGNFMGQIHWIGGEKGGVGKSLVALPGNSASSTTASRCAASTPDRSHGALLLLQRRPPPPRRSTRTTASTACSKPAADPEQRVVVDITARPNRTDALAARGRRAEFPQPSWAWASTTGA